MAYAKTTWRNGSTPINETNLNKIENELYNLENNKANKTIVVATESTDLNDYLEDGIYYFSSTYTPANIPAGVNGWLRVMSSNNGVKQIWYRFGTINSNDYQTFIRTYDKSSWSEWKRLMVESDVYYKAGDSVTLTYSTGGVLTGSRTQLQFSIPLPKRMDNVTARITSGTIHARLPSGGYLLNEADITKDNTPTLQQFGNSLYIRLTYPEEFSATNNIPVSIHVSNLKIDFS